MKITLTGSLGNVGAPLAKRLINNGHQVTVISSNKAKAAIIESIGAIPAIGRVTDTAFLVQAFNGADAVFTLIPPDYTVPNYRQYVASIGQHYADAIQRSEVPRVVNLSSIGAHLEVGTGPLKGLYDVEALFNKLKNVAVKHLRSGYFLTNLYRNINMIKHMGIMGSNYNNHTRLAMAHPEDVSTAAAEEIQSDFTGTSVRYVVSDERVAGEIAKILGTSIGRPDLPWIEFTDEEALNGMVMGGLSEEIAKDLVELNSAVRSGKLLEHYDLNKPTQTGNFKLEAFAKEFATKFNNS